MQLVRPTKIRIKSYIALVLLVAIALMIALALSHEFRDELSSLAKERVSSHFIVESMVLCIVLYIAGTLVGLLAWKNVGNEYVLKNELAKEILSEVPRAAYLLGAVTSATVLCLAAVSLLWDEHNGLGFYPSAVAAGYLLIAVYLAFVFGAWGFILEDFVSIPFVESAKIFAKLSGFSLLAITVPPIAPICLMVWFYDQRKPTDIKENCELCGHAID